MTVVAFVAEASEAKIVVTWAAKFAAVRGADLVIFYVPRRGNEIELTLGEFGDAQFSDETFTAVSNAVDGIVRTKRARKGRLSRHAISVRRISANDPVATLISRVRVESPDLFVGFASTVDSLGNGISISRKVAAKAACDSVMLYGDLDTAVSTKHIVVATSEGGHDRPMVDLASFSATTFADDVSVVAVEAPVGDQAMEVGRRHLQELLSELGHEESSRLKVRAVCEDDWTHAVSDLASGSDLLLVGSNVEKKIAAMHRLDSTLMIGVFRRTPRLAFGLDKEHTVSLLPQISPTDYSDLYEKLQAGSRWNIDFIFMLGLAAGIATLGLIQSSPAVVIGSMLLAPLMTPMVGLGLALNQGNGKLTYACFRSIGRGFLAALAISFLVAILTPGSDLTPEVVARTEPNILDLLIALFSGAAAAYALARPSLAGTIAGVAIATALVPPLCSAGIALAYGRFPESIGALSLLCANILAIILAAAATFMAMGLRFHTKDAPRRFWVRYVVAGLALCAIAISIPLVSSFMQQVREGKDNPFAFALTSEMRDALLDHFDDKPGVDIIFAGRQGVNRENDPVDIGIILSSTHPLPRSEAADLVQLIRSRMQNPDLRIKVACVADGWAEKETIVPAENTAEENTPVDSLKEAAD